MIQKSWIKKMMIDDSYLGNLYWTFVGVMNCLILPPRRKFHLQDGLRPCMRANQIGVWTFLSLKL